MVDIQKYQELTKEGYTPQDIQQAEMELQQENKLLQSYRDLNKSFPISTNSAFYTSQNDNVIKYQLELNDILERLQHFLAGDELITDEYGNRVWKETSDEKRKVLNKYGVNEVMNWVSMYLNRNTILSDYDKNEVLDYVLDFGQSFKDYLFLTYNKIGLKPEHYKILVTTVIDQIMSAYRRAIEGGERRSLREARQITQSEQLIPQNYNPSYNIQKTRGILNPARYISGKYK